MSEAGTKRSFVYTIGRPLLAAIFKTPILPVRYEGREHVDVEAPFIIIANHKSALDPLVVAVPVKRHQIRFMAKTELMKNGFLKWLLNQIRVIPVDRGNSDMAAMRASMKVLKEGNVLGVFPEGTRYKQGNMEELETGMAMLALRSGVPVIPAYLHPKVRFFHKTTCTIGEPIPTEDLIAQGINKETCDLLLKRITKTYAEMAEKAEQSKK